MNGVILYIKRHVVKNMTKKPNLISQAYQELPVDKFRIFAKRIFEIFLYYC
jgi:hypothetical protein